MQFGHSPNQQSYGVARQAPQGIFYDILIRKGYFICRPYPKSCVDSSFEVCEKYQSQMQFSDFQVRAPLCSEYTFFKLALFKGLTRIVHSISPDCYLNQQNLLYLASNLSGHSDQSRWHRDMPYQTWLPQPLAIFNALLCLGRASDNFYHALDIYEGSHHALELPNTFPESQITKVQLRHGDVLFMNSFLYHRAPLKTLKPFYLLNSVFTPRCFAPQVDLSQHLSNSTIHSSDLTDEALSYLGLTHKKRVPTRIS